MKKLLLFFLAFAAMTFSSCNNDDNQAHGGHVSLKVDNDIKYYSNPIISSTEPNENGEILRRLRAGSTDTDAIDFEIALDATGNINPEFFAYMSAQRGTYYPLEGDFNFNIEANANGYLKGTFSGILIRIDNNDEMPEILEIYNGSFDVRY